MTLNDHNHLKSQLLFMFCNISCYNYMSYLMLIY